MGLTYAIEPEHFPTLRKTETLGRFRMRVNVPVKVNVPMSHRLNWLRLEVGCRILTGRRVKLLFLSGHTPPAPPSRKPPLLRMEELRQAVTVTRAFL